MVATEDAEGRLIPKIKISENVSKITLPGFKNVVRFYDKDTRRAEADLIVMYEEEVEDDVPIEIFDPIYTWKRKTMRNFYTKKLLVPIFKNGELVYDLPDIQSIREYCKEEVESLWDEVKRLTDRICISWTITKTMEPAAEDACLHRKKIRGDDFEHSHCNRASSGISAGLCVNWEREKRISMLLASGTAQEPMEQLLLEEGLAGRFSPRIFPIRRSWRNLRHFKERKPRITHLEFRRLR